MSGPRIGPEHGTCVECGTVAPLVNFTRGAFGPGTVGGYLGGHHRPGTRRGTRCRGSFGGWVEQPLVRPAP